MLALEVTEMFGIWIAAVCVSLLLLALIATAWAIDDRGSRRRQQPRRENPTSGRHVPKAA
jgi:hypothetical protein